jgi:2-dehydropantoate 2-reductase
MGKLDVLVFGAGAIGTYIGGSLAQAGHSVTFIERPQPAKELQQHGLSLQYNIGHIYHHSNPHVVTSITEAIRAGPFDAAIFALKAYDTADALEDLRPFASKMPPFVCLQNGVENETAIAEVLGKEKVIAGSVTSAIGRRGIGDIVVERERGVGIASGHPLSVQIYAAMNEAGLNAALFNSADDLKWSKMLTNLLANATSAILNMSPAEIYAHPGLYRIEVGQLRECLAVMKAQGIHPIDLPHTPVRALAWGAALPRALTQFVGARVIGKSRGKKMPSFYIDLHNNARHSEVVYLNGAVVRFGDRLGISTPTNRFLTRTLLALTYGELPLNTYDHASERFLSEYRESLKS